MASRNIRWAGSLSALTVLLASSAAWAQDKPTVTHIDAGLRDALKTAALGLVVSAIGGVVAYWMNGRREDRTKRLQITLDQTATQIREFYAPLVALTDQLNSMTHVGEAAVVGQPDTQLKPLSAIAYKKFYLPMHEEMLTLLRTKIHLREARTDLDFDPYYQHQMAERLYWEMSDANIDVSKMIVPGYPEGFFWDLRRDYEIVQKRYDDTLAELRHSPLPLVG